MSSPHPKSNIASVEFAPNAGGATVIRLAYQDTDGNLRQANYDNGVWGTGAGIIVAKEGVAPLTPLSGTSKDEEYNFFYMNKENRITHLQWTKAGGANNRGPLPI